MNIERQKVVNSLFSVSKLLKKYYGISVTDASLTFHCPFPTHPGKDKRKSSKYFPDTNLIYCFTEQRIFSAYNILRYNGYTDRQLIKIISPHIMECTPMDMSLELSSDEYMKQQALFFRKKGDVKVLTKPLRTYLKKCKQELDRKNKL